MPKCYLTLITPSTNKLCLGLDHNFPITDVKKNNTNYKHFFFRSRISQSPSFVSFITISNVYIKLGRGKDGTFFELKLWYAAHVCRDQSLLTSINYVMTRSIEHCPTSLIHQTSSERRYKTQLNEIHPTFCYYYNHVSKHFYRD